MLLPKPMIRCLALLSTLALAGCFEAEAVLTMNPDQSVSARADFTLSRALYEFASRNGSSSALLCGQGEVEVSLSDAVCRLPETVILQHLVGGGVTELPFMTVEARSDDIVQVRIPVRAFWQQTRRQRPLTPDEAEALESARPILDTALDGRFVTIVVEGVKVIRTNGEVSEDGTRAIFRVPVADLVNEDARLPQEFSAELRYKPCANSFICR